MCGFAGLFSPDSRSASDITADLKRMSATLVHRGPDSSGEWVDENTGLGLAHRRLAIQDLSPLGHQPMHSASDKYVIVFNGEIYNFLEIQKDLSGAGVGFRGHSDTEVMLAAFEKWGVERALDRFTGMFAFALYDKTEKRLFLCRDRVGEKPLYYGWQNGIFLFGSELKALRQSPEWENSINRDALRLLFRHNFIPAPYSIFNNISKLQPGTYLVLDIENHSTHIHTYWSAEDEFRQAIANPLSGSPDEIVRGLEDTIKHSISRQLIADVPVGAFLSGGIDSSVVVVLMQSVASGPVKTFTVGFHEKEFNEAEYAAEISKILGTEHTELYVTPAEAMDVIPELPKTYDEPFADSSQIPTWLISRLARQQVTVALSGDGGDELFCGYTRYQKIIRAWRKLNRYPALLRLPVSHLLKSIPLPVLQRVFGLPLKILTDFDYRLAGQRIHERAEVWSQPTLDDYYRNAISYWRDDDIVFNSNDVPYGLNNNEVSGLDDEYQLLQYLDMNCYLPDDILTKVDRAAMAHSLETRIPLLDRHVVEYAMRIHPEINTRHNQAKWPLRSILAGYIPQRLIDRPKAGFAVPVTEWLKGPLHQWADDLLSVEKLKKEGYINAKKVKNAWEVHVKNIDDMSFRLWGILMFQSWLDNWNNQP